MRTPKLGTEKRTSRGFTYLEFLDAHYQKCSLQASSQADRSEPGTSAIWLGRDEPDDAKMNLDRRQVTALIAHLQHWLTDGSFTPKRKKPPAP